MDKETKVYFLIDPRNLKIRYIGITWQSLSDRLGNHIHDAKYRPSENWHKSRWIMQILSEGLKPIIRLATTKESREEAELLETSLIRRYKDKHNLINIIEDSGTFTSNGVHSASVFNSKKVYVYNYNGTFYKEFNSEKECAEAIGANISGVEKCLSGVSKYCHNYQIRFEKFDKIESLEEYSRGSSKEVLIKDTTTGEIIRYKSCEDCKAKLGFNLKTTGSKYLLGALNKYFGNKYMLWYKGEWKQSTYYNTGVIIQCKDQIYKFKSIKDLLSYMGYKAKSIDIDKTNEYINKYFTDIIEVKFKQPLCLVTDEDN